MLRQTIIKATRPATRAFTTSTRAMTMSGETGSVRNTGGQGDAFQKREKAQEDYAIRQREKEKLLALKKRLDEQSAHMKELEKDIEEHLRSQGGEHN